MKKSGKGESHPYIKRKEAEMGIERRVTRTGREAKLEAANSRRQITQ